MTDKKATQEIHPAGAGPSGSFVPWSHPDEWGQALLSIKKSHLADPARFEPALGLARAIREQYKTLEVPLTELCRAACPACTDVCCVRARIWYDFTDLLYLYFGGQRMPGRQIGKTTGSTGSTACRHLTASGCALSRTERPFVCTWYICPAQKQILAAGRGSAGVRINKALTDIKRLRKELEDLFISVAGQIDLK